MLTIAISMSMEEETKPEQPVQAEAEPASAPTAVSPSEGNRLAAFVLAVIMFAGAACFWVVLHFVSGTVRTPSFALRSSSDVNASQKSADDIVRAILSGAKITIEEIKQLPQSRRESVGLTPLTAAIIAGRSELALSIIRSGLGLEHVVSAALDRELFHKALDRLLHDHRELCARSSSSPLVLAAMLGDVSLTNALLEKNVMVDQPNGRDVSALFCAAMGGNTNVTARLFEAGASSAAKTHDGMTLLMAAASSGNPHVISLVVDQAKPDLSEQGPNGWTALHYLANNPSASKEGTMVLLKAGAPAEALDAELNTPVMLAAHKGNVELVTALIRPAGDLQRRNKIGETAWEIAERSGNLKLTRLLHPEYQLFAGVLTKSRYLMQLALDHGANINVADRDGVTPLIFAVTEGRPRALQRLFAFDNGPRFTVGAAGNIVSVSNRELSRRTQTIISVSETLEQGRLRDLERDVRALGLVSGDEEAGADLVFPPQINFGSFRDEDTPQEVAEDNLFFRHLRAGPDATVAFLLDHGADVNQPDSSGNTPLLYAVQIENPAMALLLVEQGANPNAENENGLSPLYHAIKLNRTPIVRAMLDKVNALPRAADQMLLSAAEHQQYPIVSRLLERGAAPDPEDQAGRRLMFLALAREDLKLAEILLKAGAELNFQDKTLRTLYRYAERESRRNLLQFFKAHGKSWESFALDNKKETAASGGRNL